MQLIHPEKLELTTVLGTVSGNTNRVMGMCAEILVKPATETTQYDISLTDESGIVVFELTSEIGTLADIVFLPLHEVYTVKIDNATANEKFIIKLMIRESQ